MWRAVQHDVERGARRTDGATHCERHSAQHRHVQSRIDAARKVALDRVDRQADQVMRQAKEPRRVDASLDDDMAGPAQDEQCAMRLDRPGEMDLLPLAIGKVRLAEGRRQGVLGRRAFGRQAISLHVSAGEGSVPVRTGVRGIAVELRGHPETNESDSMRLSRSRISVA